MVDKEGMVRVAATDRVTLEGDAKEVLKSLGFREEFQIGRNGTRISLPGGWTVEYFGLFDPPKNDRKDSRKRYAFALEKGNTGWLVTLKKQFQSEKEMQSLVTDAWRIIRRLMPEFQPVTWISVERNESNAS